MTIFLTILAILGCLLATAIFIIVKDKVKDKCNTVKSKLNTAYQKQEIKRIPWTKVAIASWMIGMMILLYLQL